MAKSVICFFLLITFLFAVMDLARISYCVFVLHDTAQAAARAAAVRRNANAAAIWVLSRTIGVAGATGVFGGVRITRRDITARRYTPYPLATLSDVSDEPIRVINAEVSYLYRPLFAWTPLMRTIRLRANYRIMEEPVLPTDGNN